MMRTLSIVLLCVASAAAVCEMYIEEPKPIIVKRFGSRTAIVKARLTNLQMAQNETVIFHCPTGITINKRSGQPSKINVSTAELLCTDDGIYFDQHKLVQQSNGAYVSCSADFTQTLYESNSSLAGCDANAMTLLIGHKLQSLPDVKLLGMCYDLRESRLRFVSFVAYAPRNVLLESETPHELSTVHLDTYIGSLSKYFRFPTKSDFEQLIQRQEHLGELFKPLLFEFNNLLQDQRQTKELTAYNDMLSIVWLRALRAGNWRLFLSALRAASDDDTGEKFDVRIGISGVATLPLAHNCNASRQLRLESSDGLVLPVPAHIWAHVRAIQPTDSSPDEFVVVAHNSPYTTVTELSSFCTDICAEIPWLSSTLFGQLHLIPNYGVMQCCRMNQLDKLTDFLLAPAKQPKASLPSTPSS